MHFVDDKNFIGIRGGREAYALFDVSDLVDAAVRGGIDLDDIECPAFLDLFAWPAFVAGFTLHAKLCVFGACFAVYDLGQYPSGGRFAAAARAVEEVGVG